MEHEMSTVLLPFAVPGDEVNEHLRERSSDGWRLVSTSVVRTGTGRMFLFFWARGSS
jgi:hypothetical protein